MKNILLPTDFSDNSWNAIKYAVQLFKGERCNFFILHTYTPMIYNIEYVNIGAASYGLIDAMRETADKNLNEIQLKIEHQFKNPKHTYTKSSSFNILTNEIEELHKNHVIDYIIMGTKGATGLSEILFGSNTVHVIKNAKCPVLAIPSGFSFTSPKEILFPSDYEVSFTEKHIKPILEIALLYSSSVNILNVSFGKSLSEKQENNRQKLNLFFKGTAHLFHSESEENVTEAIANFGLKVPVSLLVMLNNKHSFFDNLFFKSKINQIGLHLNIPFLVLPLSNKNS